MSSCGITHRFRRLPPTSGQFAHVFLTRPPRKPPEGDPVRLACIRHAASVDPEPGSNSPPSVPAHSPVPAPESPLPGPHRPPRQAAPVGFVTLCARLDSPERSSTTRQHRHDRGLPRLAPATSRRQRTARRSLRLPRTTHSQAAANLAICAADHRSDPFSVLLQKENRPDLPGGMPQVGDHSISSTGIV
jgi:hypothetical protein